MKLVVATDPGVVELAWTWLPLWLGLNNQIKEELAEELSTAFLGKSLTEEVLAQAHTLVLDFFEKKFPALPGLRSYLAGIRYVEVL